MKRIGTRCSFPILITSIESTSTLNIEKRWIVIVTQLAEQSLPTQEDSGSNSAITTKILLLFFVNCLCCFGFSWAQQLITWANTSLNVLQLKCSIPTSTWSLSFRTQIFISNFERDFSNEKKWVLNKILILTKRNKKN